MPLDVVVVDRPNRFVVTVRFPNGREASAYLANTARLTGLLEPGRPVLVEPAAEPGRRTRFTVTRIWDGCWVGIQAYRAPGLLAEWIDRRGELEHFGAVVGIEREIPLGKHRIDLVVHLAGGGSVWVEVKSGSRTIDGSAPLSRTPSARGAEHLRVLADLTSRGQRAAVAFVVQRPDVERFLVGGDADPGWIDAVRAAHRAGVRILAYRCRVDPDAISVARSLPIAFAR